MSGNIVWPCCCFSVMSGCFGSSEGHGVSHASGDSLVTFWAEWKEGVTCVECVSGCSEEADRGCGGVGRMLGLVRIMGNGGMGNKEPTLEEEEGQNATRY